MLPPLVVVTLTLGEPGLPPVRPTAAVSTEITGVDAA
jgi:hypothetical protein